MRSARRFPHQHRGSSRRFLEIRWSFPHRSHKCRASSRGGSGRERWKRSGFARFGWVARSYQTRAGAHAGSAVKAWIAGRFAGHLAESPAAAAGRFGTRTIAVLDHLRGVYRQEGWRNRRGANLPIFRNTASFPFATKATAARSSSLVARVNAQGPELSKRPVRLSSRSIGAARHPRLLDSPV